MIEGESAIPRHVSEWWKNGLVIPDDVHRPGPDLGVTPHDGHAGGEGAIDAEHHKLSAPGKHGQVAVRRGVVSSEISQKNRTLCDKDF